MTLAERLQKDPLALDPVLRYAEELPDALGPCASGGRSPHYFIPQYHFRSRTFPGSGPESPRVLYQPLAQ